MTQPAKEFKLRTGFIELDNLLKSTGVVSSGAEAKIIIREGSVKVNDAVENRVRRKLHAGDTVIFGDNKIRVT